MGENGYSPEEDLRQMRLDAWHARKSKTNDPHRRSDYIKTLHCIRDTLQSDEPWNKISRHNIDVGVHLLAVHYAQYLREYICREGYFGCSIRDEAFIKSLRNSRKKSSNVGEIILCDELIKMESDIEKRPRRIANAYGKVRVAAEMMANRYDVELNLLAEDPEKPIVHQFTDLKGNVVGESFSAQRPETLIYLPGATPYTQVLHEKLERHYGRLTA